VLSNGSGIPDHDVFEFDDDSGVVPSVQRDQGEELGSQHRGVILEVS
jgi:hypothetical protein